MEHRSSSTAARASSPKSLVLAAGLGVVGAIVASVFLGFISHAQTLIWHDLPGVLGLDQAPGWLVVLAPLVGVAMVALAWRLPGATGAGPLEGFHFDIGPKVVASVLLAAVGTIVFGLSLGPEAPLIACGTAVGALLTRKAPLSNQQFAMALAGVAAIGAIFGNPFVTAFVLLEFAALGAMPTLILIPAFVALAAGYLVQIGIGPWTGLGTHSLSVQGLASYPNVRLADLVGAGLVAVVAAVVALLARGLGMATQNMARRTALLTLIVTALATSGLALVVRGVSGQPIDLVMFSGQEGMAQLLTVTSLSAVVLVLVAKTLAYGLALGSGFRGGPIFPAVFLGVATAVALGLAVPSWSVTALVVTAIAASSAAALKLPFTSALLALVIVAGAGMAVAPFAIIGAVIGLIFRMAFDQGSIGASDQHTSPV
ncbi:unannotated protein [freshwater metagenome]|uniref:Unannotated protein n=1 Tax=freshwater metagenome TaxID=449393 RepID=A0A6J7DPT2_9ZZZZ|nr:hypothetical protein [Actinomycetota bacterium]